MVPCHEIGRDERNRREGINFQGEKCRCKLAQLFDRPAAISSKFTQRLKINDAPRAGRSIRVRRFEFVEGLSGLGMHGEPVMRTGLWDRLKFRGSGRKRAAKSGV